MKVTEAKLYMCPMIRENCMPEKCMMWQYTKKETHLMSAGLFNIGGSIPPVYSECDVPSEEVTEEGYCNLHRAKRNIQNERH